MPELTNDDRERLRVMIEEQWSAAAIDADWDGCMALCSDDFVYLPPDSPALHGKDEAKGFLEAFPTVLALTQTVESIVGTTDLAACRISFQLTVEQEGQELSVSGKGLGSATKTDGGWRLAQACFNLDAPLG